MNSTTLIGLVGALALLGATIPTDKEVLSIDRVDSEKYGAVKFEHKKHVERKGPDGADITCKTCHHTLTADSPAEAKDVKACITCHVQEGAAQVEHGGKKAPFYFKMKSPGKTDMKSIVLHENCTTSCHNKLAADVKKKLRKCTVCHEKK